MSIKFTDRNIKMFYDMNSVSMEFALPVCSARFMSLAPPNLINHIWCTFKAYWPDANEAVFLSFGKHNNSF